jgi:hypothetical protein
MVIFNITTLLLNNCLLQMRNLFSSSRVSRLSARLSHVLCVCCRDVSHVACFVLRH